MDNQKSNDEEEYFFPDSDDKVKPPFIAAKSENPAAHLFDNFERKHIYLIVGAMLGLFVLYKLIMLLVHTEFHRKSAPAVVEAPKEIAPPASKPQIVSPMENEKFSALATQLSDLSNKIDKQEETNNRVESSLTNLQSQLANLNTAVQQLSQQIIQQRAREQEAKKKRVYVKPVTKAPEYYIKALIPGRAWLQAPDGSTITVGPGDSLPGGGEVAAIDVMAGTLTTSSGAVLKFHPNDR